MNAIEQGLIVSDLNAARGNASLAQSHLLGARQLLVLHGHDVTPLHLAKFHFEEAARLLDQALGKKTPPAPTSVAQTAGSAVPQAAGLPEPVRLAVPSEPSPTVETINDTK